MKRGWYAVSISLYDAVFVMNRPLHKFYQIKFKAESDSNIKFGLEWFERLSAQIFPNFMWLKYFYFHIAYMECDWDENPNFGDDLNATNY